VDVILSALNQDAHGAVPIIRQSQLILLRPPSDMAKQAIQTTSERIQSCALIVMELVIKRIGEYEHQGRRAFGLAAIETGAG
jgi:hypothetical protein